MNLKKSLLLLPLLAFNDIHASNFVAIIQGGCAYEYKSSDDRTISVYNANCLKRAISAPNTPSLGDYDEFIAKATAIAQGVKRYVDNGNAGLLMSHTNSPDFIKYDLDVVKPEIEDSDLYYKGNKFYYYPGSGMPMVNFDRDYIAVKYQDFSSQISAGTLNQSKIPEICEKINVEATYTDGNGNAPSSSSFVLKSPDEKPYIDAYLGTEWTQRCYISSTEMYFKIYLEDLI